VHATVAPPELSPPKSKHLSKWISWSLGIAIALIAFVVVVQLAGGIQSALEALEQADPGWIALGVVFEAASFLFIALHLRRLMRVESALSTPAAYRLALVVYGFGAVTPASPVEGVALGVQALRRKGVSKERALFALGFSEWFSNAALFTILAADLLVATLLRHVHRDERMPALLLAGGLVVALVVVGRIVTSKRTIAALSVLWNRLTFWRPRASRDELQVTIDRLHADRDAVIGGRRNQAVLILLVAGAWLFDMACLEAALVAMGVHANLDQLILAYGAGVLATAVPFVPAGLGLTEIAVPAVLHHYGVPLAPALAGALAYRAIGTFLPAGTGGLFALAMQRRGRRDVDASTATEVTPADYREVPSGA
jgi:putative heme transporter